MWPKHDDGSWSANGMWSRTHGENRLDTFLAERVRPLTKANPGASHLEPGRTRADLAARDGCTRPRSPFALL